MIFNLSTAQTMPKIASQSSEEKDECHGVILTCNLAMWSPVLHAHSW